MSLKTVTWSTANCVLLFEIFWPNLVQINILILILDKQILLQKSIWTCVDEFVEIQ